MLLFLLACQPTEKTPDPSATTENTDSETTDTATTPSLISDTVLNDIRAAVAQDLKVRGMMASGASVAIYYQGQIAFAEGFGSAHPDQEVPVTPDTLFQIGSDTKKLTAIALLQQADQGKLSVSDTLATHVPELQFTKDPGLSSQITLHHLISHQTDIYDYTPWSDDPADGQLAAVATGRFAENEHAYAPSGSYWNYANPNFSLAGLVVEKATGRSYADVMEQDVFAPLHLEHSYARLSEAQAAGNYATGYGIYFPNGFDSFDPFESDLTYKVQTVEMADQSDNAFIRPAGLVWSTASDMAMLGAFLMHGDTTVLSEQSLNALHTPWVPLYPTIPGQSYAYGLMVLDGFYAGSDNYVETPLWEHGGNTMTMTSAFYVLPEQDLAVSILSNGYGDQFNNTLLTILTEVPELPAASSPPSYPPASDLESYVGTWNDPNGIGTITITWVDDHLEASIPALEAAGHKVTPTLDPVYKDLFYLTIDGAQYDITFIDGADGTPHQFLRNRQFGGVLGSANALRVRPYHLLPPLPQNPLLFPQ